LLLTLFHDSSGTSNNQQTYRLEAYGRTLVSQGYEVYIIMDVMVGGTGSAGSATTINNGNITVPTIFGGTCYTSSGTYDVSRGTTGMLMIDTLI
jgi:endonuclease G